MKQRLKLKAAQPAKDIRGFFLPMWNTMTTEEEKKNDWLPFYHSPPCPSPPYVYWHTSCSLSRLLTQPTEEAANVLSGRRSFQFQPLLQFSRLALMAGRAERA